MNRALIIGLNSRYTHTNLAIRYLSQAAGCPFYESHINQNPNVILEDICTHPADILCFSCYIWNIDLALRLSREIKQIKPEVTLVLGGPEVSFNAKERLSRHPEIDYVYCGEGEIGLPKLLSAIFDGTGSFPPGTVYRQGGVIAGDDTYQFVSNLDDIPFPYDHFPKNQIIYYETSRGCPFSCTYCQSGHCPGGVRRLSMPRIQDDLKRITAAGVPLVKLVDRTFNADKAFVKQLLPYLIKETGQTCFHLEVGADLFDEELLHLFRQAPAGKFQLEAGVQSCNEKTLLAVRRKTDLSKLFQNIRTLLSFGTIPIHLDLIAGLPEEDFSSFANSFNAVYRLHPHMLQLGFLKMLHGSTLRQNNPGIVFRQTPPYEVLKTQWLTAQELFILHGIDTLVDRYFNSGRFPRSLACLQARFPHPFAFYLALHNYAKANHLSGRPLGAAAQFDLLADFASTCMDDPAYLITLLKTDYHEHGAKGNLPKAFSAIALPFDGRALKARFPGAKAVDLLPFHPDTGKKQHTVLVKKDWVCFYPY